MLDVRLPDGRRRESLRALVEGFDLPVEQNIVARELGRDRDASHHLVAVRDREPPHRHDQSALTVVVLEGHGRMLVDDQELPVDTGSIVYVPRATVHAFINAEGAPPAIAYVVFSPPAVEGDRVPPDAPLPAEPEPAQ